MDKAKGKEIPTSYLLVIVGIAWLIGVLTGIELCGKSVHAQNYDYLDLSLSQQVDINSHIEESTRRAQTDAVTPRYLGPFLDPCGR